MEVEAAKLIGAGLAMIGTIGAGLGIGVVVNGAVQGMARNRMPAAQCRPI
jgi:F0F1-type ATP synthase membrane subunit c/vacuolar-type H+-ATPase subunit K